MKKIYLLLCVLLGGCTQLPSGVQPVKNFEISRYLGKWYEIARLDHSFERGLSNVTADYSLREDGMVRVINRGYSLENNRWKSATGKAKFVRTPDEGFLKVSFFGPFYGSYIVFELDHEGYQYGLVSGPNKDYLWILARQPVLTDATRTALLQKAKNIGFATEELLFVSHDLIDESGSGASQ